MSAHPARSPETPEALGPRGPGILGVASRMLGASFTLSASAIVTRGDGAIVLVEMRYRARDHFGLPGGGAARREGPEDAIRRELAEEIGLTGEYRADPILAFRPGRGRHVQLLYGVRAPDTFVVRIRRPLEIRTARFFTPNELPLLLPETASVLRRAGWPDRPAPGRTS